MHNYFGRFCDDTIAHFMLQLVCTIQLNSAQERNILRGQIGSMIHAQHDMEESNEMELIL